MKFALSYSGGKDSVLALKKALDLGHEPAALLTTFDEAKGNSHFHRIPRELLVQAAAALNIPLRLIITEGERYTADFELALTRLKQEGVSMVVFGDIDIDEHRSWCTRRCENTGLEAFFPLWQIPRHEVVSEFIDTGFQALITALDTQRLDASFLGRVLSHEVIKTMAVQGVDVCGEAGEFHTFVVGGPLFQVPVRWRSQEPIASGHHLFLPLISQGE